MRHILSLLLAVSLVMTGCGSSNAVQEPTQRFKQSLAGLVDELAEDYSLTMPMAVDDELMQELMGVEPHKISEYSGYLSMNGDCPDHIIAVRAAPDCAEDVAKAFSARRSFLLEAYADRPEAYRRVQAGCVVFRGDYVFLIIGGRPDREPETEVAEITKIIEDNFEK